MADTEADQLISLQRERERLEAILMGDANWRALCALDERTPEKRLRQGNQADPQRDAILRMLETNAAFAARRDILSRIARLSPASRQQPHPAPITADPTISDRQQSSQFRTRIKVKPKSPRSNEQETENQSAAGDDLTCIDGIDADRARSLRDLGVNTFAEIAAWTDEEVKIVDELLACPQGDACARNWRTSAASLVVASKSKLVAGRQPDRDTASTAPPSASQSAPENTATAAATDSFFTSNPDAGIAIIPPEESASQAEPKPRETSPPATRRRPASSLIELLALAGNRPDESNAEYPAGAPQSQRLSQRTHSKTDRNSLVRRLQTVRTDQQPPSPGNYAAYRGVAEEASVTIVVPDGENAGEEAADAPAATSRDTPPQAVAARRSKSMIDRE